MNDDELLSALVRAGAQDAFEALVQRHLGLVYSVALRTVRQPLVAQEISQKVFCILAEQAGSIRDPKLLPGWLHRTTRQLAVLHIRTEERRHRREQAVAMNLIEQPEQDQWSQLEPFLDQALETLGHSDRTAVLLRFFESQSMAQVGAALGISEAAAKMRISRAIDKLRNQFAMRGILCSAAGLELALAGNALISPPAELLAVVLNAVATGAHTTVAATSSGLEVFLRIVNQRAMLPAAGAIVVLLLLTSLVRIQGETSSTRSESSSTGIAPTVSVTLPNPGSVAIGATPASRITVNDELRLRVIDAATGKPLAGVGINAKEFSSQQSSGELRTDSQGDCMVPTFLQDEGAFHFRLIVRHEGYVSAMVSWSSFQMDDPSDVPAEYTVQLKRGIRVGGYVKDSLGRPIPQATVKARGEGVTGAPPRELSWLADVGSESAVTDPSGKWAMDSILEDMSHLSFEVSAPGFQNTDFTTDIYDRNLQGLHRTPKAHLLSGNAVAELTAKPVLEGSDENPNLNPLSTASIQSRESLNRAKAQTTPTAKLSDPISFPEQPSALHSAQRKIQSPKRSRVVGRVVDARTGAAVDRFRVLIWTRERAFERKTEKPGEAGVFKLSLPEPGGDIEIKASGFEPARQVVQTGGGDEVTLEYRLTPNAGWNGVVRLPNGTPAAGAEIAISSHSKRVILGDRRFMWKDQAHVTTADAVGVFHLDPLPPELAAGRVLVAVHSQGYAETDADTFGAGQTVKLEPWGRVEGVVHSRTDYPPELKIILLNRPWNPWVFSVTGIDQFMTTPNSLGVFALENIPPGYYGVGLLPTGSGTHEKYSTLRVLPGQTTRIDLGNDGAEIAGRIVSQELSEDFDFSQSMATLERLQSRPVDLPRRTRQVDFPDLESFNQASRLEAAKIVAYWQSPEGLAAWMEQRTYSLETKPDGTLMGRHIPAGEYRIKVIAQTVSQGRLGSLKFLESQIPVRIGPATNGNGKGRVDLGQVSVGRMLK